MDYSWFISFLGLGLLIIQIPPITTNIIIPSIQGLIGLFSTKEVLLGSGFSLDFAFKAF
jgi:hypothetical protein